MVIVHAVPDIVPESPSMFVPTIKLSRFMWRWRWWLVSLAGVLLFLIMNSAPITSDSGIISEADRQIRRNFAMIFAMMAAQLVAWFIGVLHAFVMHKVKWGISILALPLVAFIYFLIGAKGKDAEE